MIGVFATFETNAVVCFVSLQLFHSAISGAAWQLWLALVIALQVLSLFCLTGCSIANLLHLCQHKATRVEFLPT